MSFINLKILSFCTNILILFSLNNLESSSVTFGSKYSTIKIDSGAACIFENPRYIENGVINREQYGIARGAPIIFKYSTFIDCGNKLKITGILDPNEYIFTLNGEGLFSGRTGSFYQPISVIGKNNIIEGNLTLGNNITLQDSNTSVSVNLISNLNGNIYLNGGMLCLMENNLKFNDGKKIVGPGTICESGSKLIYGAKPLTFSENIRFINAEDIQFNADVTLQGNWTFSGNSTLGGNLNSLYIKDGKIGIAKNSSLLIKDIILHDIQDGNLFCMDNSATVTFQNVTIYLANDYTFSIGKFATSDQVAFLGNCKFIYQSPMESLITSKSILTLDQGITFSYDPNCMRKDLIVFEDEYSTLALNGATLHATLTGMNLTKGTLVINSNSYLSSEQITLLDKGITYTLLDEGITIGNDNAQEDLYCQSLNGSSLELKTGSLKYRNVSPTSWVMENNLSSVAINANSNLYLYQDLNISPGFLNYKGRGGFFYAPGKKTNGSLLVSGYINYLELN